MNDILDLIYEAVEEMRKEGHGLRENVQIYVSDSIYKTITASNNFLQNLPDRERTVQTEPMGIGDPTKAAFGEEPDSFETYEIHQFDGMTILREPRLNDEEILLMDMGGIKQINDMQIIEHPVCVEKIRLSSSTDQSPTRQCANCNSTDEVFVEGDEDEPYCSLKCLNEAYNA